MWNDFMAEPKLSYKSTTFQVISPTFVNRKPSVKANLQSIPADQAVSTVYLSCWKDWGWVFSLA